MVVEQFALHGENNAERYSPDDNRAYFQILQIAYDYRLYGYPAPTQLGTNNGNYSELANVQPAPIAPIVPR